MPRPLTIPGILPTHQMLEYEVRAGSVMTRHTFEANARHCTDKTDGIMTMRVVRGQLQVVGAAGHEAWAIGPGQLVALSGPGPYEIVALVPSEMWIGVHHGLPRGPRLAFA